MESQQEHIFKEVREYYLENLDLLKAKVRFHFLSRAYLWTRKEIYRDKLNLLRTSWWKRFDRVLTALELLAQNERKYIPKIGKKHYRAPYKDTYGAIWIYNRFFFMCLFDRTVYEGDAFFKYRTHIHVESFTALYNALLADQKAVHTLSTPAVNFLLLSSYFFPELFAPISPDYFLEVGKYPSTLNLEDKRDATTYLYTHAIIGRSLFYSEDIPVSERPSYVHMLEIIESTIEEAFEEMSLDHKCEFLVCAHLCGYETRLKEKIKNELLVSKAPQGNYFVNTHNKHHRRGNVRSVSSMEHTNILALMAFLGRSGL